MARVIMPLPHRDFDPSEAAVSWRVLTGRGHEVRFATPDGAPAAADPIMLDGIGLDPWSRLPGLRRLRLIGLLLRANRDARRAYAELERDPNFRAPLRWDQALADDFDGLLLPGGHRARGMRDYLESAVLQRLVVAFFDADKPVGAICHGVLLAARSRRDDGKSILYGRRTASLTWAQERAASTLAHVGRWWDRDYYRTYVEEPGQPEGFMSVEAEVTRALAVPEDYRDVPRDAPDFRRKTSGLARDSIDDARPAWVVQDGNYVSARWPGDARTFAVRFAELLG
ncbi:type 1 glutamine amidotransferase domain-containing protein [Sphingomonas mali]|uniref:type 1 glutamine amidotransferase domain-containing protein n=1 Tax=Sphingomonas mali TaxID=40682 RepID=UPI000833F239|nr:type 1 glutamine amidotransferase domain-containing protein [Sphingomonas mali]